MKSVVLLVLVLCPLISTSAGVWPSGGELESPLYPGASVDITWDNALNANAVRIDLWDGERHTFRTLATLESRLVQSYTWTIPPDVSPGELYRFLVRDAHNPSRAEYSIGFHRIRGRGDVALTVEDDSEQHAEVVVSPLPADERARIAWTKYDAQSIDIIDMQGTTIQHIEPQRSTRACVAVLSAIRSGSYTVVATMANGKVLRRALLVTH